MESLIRKQYTPVDNSYYLNLTDQKVKFYLAGTFNDKWEYQTLPITVTIISEPYQQVVKTITKEFKTYTFVTVQYKQYQIRILFDKKGLK